MKSTTRPDSSASARVIAPRACVAATGATVGVGLVFGDAALVAGETTVPRGQREPGVGEATPGMLVQAARNTPSKGSAEYRL